MNISNNSLGLITGLIVVIIILCATPKILPLFSKNIEKTKQNFLPGIQGPNTTYIQRSFNNLMIY